MRLPRMVVFLLCILWGLWGAGTGMARSFAFEVPSQELVAIDQMMVSPFLRLTPDRGNFGTYYIGDNLVLSYWSARYL